MDLKTSRSRSQQRLHFWRKIVSGQPRSGMSVAAWCGKHGVSAPSFYVWRKRLLLRDAERESCHPQLLPLEIIPAAVDARLIALEIDLPGGVTVGVRAGCDLELLRQVLTMLRQDPREIEAC